MNNWLIDLLLLLLLFLFVFSHNLPGFAATTSSVSEMKSKMATNNHSSFDLDNGDDHCSKEMIKMLKETLNYHKGDHHTFFVFGASVSVTFDPSCGGGGGGANIKPAANFKETAKK